MDARWDLPYTAAGVGRAGLWGITGFTETALDFLDSVQVDSRALFDEWSTDSLFASWPGGDRGRDALGGRDSGVAEGSQ